jgi:hypothetical protein
MQVTHGKHGILLYVILTLTTTFCSPQTSTSAESWRRLVGLIQFAETDLGPTRALADLGLWYLLDKMQKFRDV